MHNQLIWLIGMPIVSIPRTVVFRRLKNDETIGGQHPVQCPAENWVEALRTFFSGSTYMIPCRNKYFGILEGFEKFDPCVFCKPGPFWCDIRSFNGDQISDLQVTENVVHNVMVC